MKPLREGTAGARSELALEQGEGQNLAPPLAGSAAWRNLLDPHLPPGEPVIVLADPEDLPSEAVGRRLVRIRAETAGSKAGVARLEAQRAHGMRFVLIPASARWKLQVDVHLAEHLRAVFRPVAEDPEVGTVVEATAHAVPDGASAALGDVIDSLCAGDRHLPILDWTTHGMAQYLPGRTVFQPVKTDAGVLPYLDHTIEVVLVDQAERMDEAARVAAGTAVLVATDDAGGVSATETRRVRSEHAPAPAPVLILVATRLDDDWLGQLTEAVAGRPGVDVRAAIEPLVAAAEPMHRPSCWRSAASCLSQIASRLPRVCWRPNRTWAVWRSNFSMPTGPSKPRAEQFSPMARWRASGEALLRRPYGTSTFAPSPRPSV